MKTFIIKSSLAYGLTHRLKTLDAQRVYESCKDLFNKPSQVIRKNLKVVDAINEANKDFVVEVENTERKKRAIFDEVKAKFEKEKQGKSKEEEAKLSRDFRTEFNEKAAEVQKESKADPETPVNVSLPNDDYAVLTKVVEETSQLWDVNGDGKGQALFLEVVTSIETLTEAEDAKTE